MIVAESNRSVLYSADALSPSSVSAICRVRSKGVELKGAGCDESPHCYKRLPEVLDQHKNTIRILHTLEPLGVAMAGENEFDPFRD